MIDSKLKLYNALERCDTFLYHLKCRGNSNKNSYSNILLYGLTHCLDYEKLVDVAWQYNVRWAYKGPKIILNSYTTRRKCYYK